MDIDITFYPLGKRTKAQLDALGIPYDEEKDIIIAPEGTISSEDDYGEVYTLPGGITIKLTSDPPTTRVFQNEERIEDYDQ